MLYNIAMITLEIPPNPNCDAMELRLFNSLAPPQSAGHVRLDRGTGQARWFEVTGWTKTGERCPAWAQKIDDSGEGVAFLLYGGDAGLRLRPMERPGPWQLGDPEQWGEPFLIVADLDDVRLQSPQAVAPQGES